LVTEILESILAYPIIITDIISRPILYEAARLKTTYSLSLLDAIGLATAISIDGVFVTSDHHELDLVDQHESTPWTTMPLIIWPRSQSHILN
jgi:predicted nucleic acid-binding protein